MSSSSHLPHAIALIGYTAAKQTTFLDQLNASPHDTVVLDAALAGGIKDVRDFSSQLLLSPQFGPLRLGVIQSAEKLTPQAQNALLKILEEPPRAVKLVLCITTEATVLPTVLSRCLRLYGYAGVGAGKATVPFQVNNPLDQFNAAEGLAKNDQIEAIVLGWLNEAYTNWCTDGRPKDDLPLLESFWQLYQGITSSLNKRLLLESVVLQLELNPL